MVTLDPESLAAEYAAGDSLRTIAARHGTHERAVRETLLAAGVTLRSRGVQPRVDPATIRDRVQAGVSLNSIAADLGVSVSAVKYAATRIQPRTTRRIAQPRDLTPTERRRLETAWRKLPRDPYLRVDWSTSPQVERFLGLVLDLHAGGVPIAWQERALGVNAGYLHVTLGHLDRRAAPRPVTRSHGRREPGVPRIASGRR